MTYLGDDYMELLKINEIKELMLQNGKQEDDVICSMVYKFAKNLPYSMDYLDDDFVLGEFINYIPSNSNKYLFNNYGSIYNKMIDWSDTIVSGIQLQICNIFQKMILSNKHDNYSLCEEDYYNYGFDKLTSMEHYNKNIFNLLRKLPEYVKNVNLCDNKEYRRNKLDEVYGYIWQVTNYVVKYAKNEVIYKDIVIKGELKEFHHRWKPYRDLEMMYYFERIENYNLDCRELIDYIKSRISSDNKGIKLAKRIENK